VKNQEIKNKDRKELERELSEKREKLQSLRFDLISGKIKSAKDIRSTRKEIARALTAINAISQNK
jgi:ribosomal protein L29